MDTELSSYPRPVLWHRALNISQNSHLYGRIASRSKRTPIRHCKHSQNFEGLTVVPTPLHPTYLRSVYCTVYRQQEMLRFVHQIVWHPSIGFAANIIVSYLQDLCASERHLCAISLLQQPEICELRPAVSHEMLCELLPFDIMQESPAQGALNLHDLDLCLAGEQSQNILDTAGRFIPIHSMRCPLHNQKWGIKLYSVTHHWSMLLYWKIWNDKPAVCAAVYGKWAESWNCLMVD